MGLEFDAPNDDAITGGQVAPPSEGTVAVWIRSDGAPAARQRFWGLGGNFEMWQDPDGLVCCDIDTDGVQGGCITTLPLVTAGRWYHLVVVFDSDDDSYRIYLNGELHKSGISSFNIAAEAANYLSFGARTGTTERFDGALDDFRIYNRKLDATEVFDLFGLVAWYKLDETSGTVAYDSTGLGNDGTFVGNPALNVTANGAPSQASAVGFDGSNYIEVPGLFEKSANITAAAWVRLDGVDAAGADVVSLGDYFRLRLRTGLVGAEASFYNGSTWITTTADQVVLNSGWHHLTIVLSDSDALTLYIDGVEAASENVGSAILYSGQGANSRIASHGNGGSTTDLIGRIDDVKVFNRPLGPEEAFQLYRGSRINGIRILKWVETR
jgi:Concanavalin A-like lectin/glucanases superfamily